MIIFEQRRDFGEKINATFTFLTENIRGLGLSLLYIVGPVALVGGIFAGYGQAGAFGTATSLQTPDQLFAFYSKLLSPYFLIGYLFSLLSYVLAGLVNYVYIQLYRQAPTRPIEVSDVWAGVQPFIGPSILLSIASGFIILFASLLLVLPGIWAGVALSLSTAVLVFERANVGEAVSRSFRLVNDNWWATFGLLLVMYIVSGLIGSVFTLPAGILGGLFGAGEVKQLSATLLILTTVFSTVGATVVRAIVLTSTAFQYFNLVEQKEGSGLDRAIDRIGQTPTRSDDLPPSIRRATEEEGEY